MTVRLVSLPVSVTTPERLVWRLTKGERIVEARVRELSDGCELRFLMDDVPRWSQLFRGESGELMKRATEKRQDFERLGWHPLTH